jgi:hypothetical protein
MTTDRATTILGLIAAIAVALENQGIYPHVMAAIAAVSLSAWGYLTNKIIKP